MGPSDKHLTGELREKYLAALNDPDALTLKPTIKMLEEAKAKLPKDSPLLDQFEKNLNKLRKAQAKLEKRT